MSSPIRKPGSCAPPHTSAAHRRLAARAIILSALTSLLLAAVAAFAEAPDAQLDSILASLAKRRHGHALYSEQIDSALFKRPLHTSGELLFDAPDRLEKKILQPAAEDLLVEGDVLTIARGKHRTTMRLSDYPQLSPFLNGLRATLAGDRAMLEKNFHLAVKASGSDWELTLQPLPGEIKPVYERIQIRGVDGSVQSVTLERATGERTTITLSELAES
jgi:hypothetical protein